MSIENGENSYSKTLAASEQSAARRNTSQLSQNLINKEDSSISTTATF